MGKHRAQHPLAIKPSLRKGRVEFRIPGGCVDLWLVKTKRYGSDWRDYTVRLVTPTRSLAFTVADNFFQASALSGSKDTVLVDHKAGFLNVETGKYHFVNINAINVDLWGCIEVEDSNPPETATPVQLLGPGLAKPT